MDGDMTSTKNTCEIPNDVINTPRHYTRTEIEPIEVTETWGLGFHLGNVIKYVERAGHKNSGKEIEDLKKARWYLDRYIQLKEAEQI